MKVKTVFESRAFTKTGVIVGMLGSVAAVGMAASGDKLTVYFLMAYLSTLCSASFAYRLAKIAEE